MVDPVSTSRVDARTNAKASEVLLLGTNGEGRGFHMAKFREFLTATRSYVNIYIYVYGITGEIFLFFFHFLLFVYRVELIGWTVKHTEFSVARQSFPGPRECTPRNRVAAVRMPHRGASLPSVPVAVSCSFSSPCSEVSLCELWIYKQKWIYQIYCIFFKAII